MFNSDIDLGEVTETGSVAGSPQFEKPWVSSEALIQRGATVYKAQCALCHGPKGLGDGTPGLIPPPRNLVEGKWKQGGRSQDLFMTFQKGIAGSSMVSFKHLPNVDLWALVHYVRSITKNKVEDDSKQLEEFAKNYM